MGKKRKQLSQAEVWDDSALLQSWNDALAEYNLYHSIHARGERVEDVIKESEAEEKEDVNVIEDHLRQGAETNGISSEELEDGELGEEPQNAQAYLKGNQLENSHGPSTIGSEQKVRLADADTAMNQQQKPGIPDAIINGVNDEALKNLMMSWYYAGYYTGLYDGQQKMQNNASK